MSKIGVWERFSWAPVAATAFAFAPQRGVEFRVVDGPNDQCFGFPLVWQCDSIFSLEFIWFSGPLLLDLAAYSIAAVAMVWLFQRLPIPLHRLARICVVLVLWTIGVASLALIVWVFMAAGFHREIWPDYLRAEDVVRTSWSALFRF